MRRRVIKQALSASVILTTLMLAAGLSGCGKTESSASLLADASQYQQKGDNKAALIQLKNAASKSPEDAEVRIRLATLYNLTGDPVSAEKEIRKAISLGADATRTAPELAKALMQQGQGQKAIDESAAAAAKAGPELLAIRGDAFLSLNQTDKARDAYQQALAAKPGYAEALLGMARLAMIGKDVAGASALTEQAIAANPKDPSVYFFKAALLRAQDGKSDEAIAALGQAITLKPDFANALVERATLEIGARKFDAAKADLDAARKVAPNAMIVAYTQALLDFTQGKFGAAHETLQKLLNSASEHMPTLLLSGATELNLGLLNQAEQHLKKYIGKNPDSAHARKLLAQAQLKSAEPADAAATLAPLLKDGTQDPQLLALAAEVAMQSRDFAQAAQYLEKAAALSPDAAALHTSLGMARLGMGDKGKAMAELERATALAPQSEQAGVMLVRTALSLQQLDKATAAVKALVAANSGSAVARDLEGGVNLAKGDRAGARASFDKAVSLAPTSFSPVMHLAQMDMTDNKPDAAKQRLVAFLEKDKKNVEAMSALASLALSQKHEAEATSWLEQASAQNPDAVAPAQQLAMHYLRTKQQAKALTLVRKLQTANPANAELLDLLGQTQLANQDQTGALETYSKLVNVVPKSAAAQYRLASVHMMLKNETAAAEDLKKALALQPGYMPAQVAQVELAMRNKQPEQAIALARLVQKQPGQQAAGLLMEGDVHMQQQQPALALPLYEKSFALAPSSKLMIAIHRLLLQAGKEKEADQRLAQWVERHPADVVSLMYVAESNIAKKQYKPAITQLVAILKLTPDDPTALNNLAWVYQQEKDPKALETAEHAFRVAGEMPAVMDTLGTILTERGDTKRSVPMLQKAVTLAPTDLDMRLHLAQALAKSGDKVNARKELQPVLAPGSGASRIAAAQALMQQL